ncbi:MAG: 4Fe-4S dicluster domain-containing protein [Chloroflexi bacterium]|nr:4Fe-4S dicluster domain-containing protein [Chloroflexota bacterium]
MGLLVISKEDIASFIARLVTEYEVVAPVARENKFAFAPITDPAQVRLDYTTTILPPKKAFLPPEETLFAFKLNGAFTTQPIFDERPRVLLGAHTCDLHAIKLLDAVFETGFADEHYRKRRAHTLIVSLECLAPCDEHSFCKSMETLTARDGYDLHLTDVGDAYTVDVGTEQGKQLLARFANAGDATRLDLDHLNKKLAAKWSNFAYRLDFNANDLPAVMALSYKNPLWEELGKKCLACGQCNLVCPTCYCFNVKDDTGFDHKTGERKRVWDSCQLDEFARVATGENFRKTRAQRQRHRFFRKGKYIPEMHGALGCVGCGRCARACLVDISPVQVFNALHQTRGL